MWYEVREKTRRASAPELIHNDSDLIKRAIRDIYNRDIEEVLVEGEDGYKAATDFMKLLMPSHARRVKQYADAVSLRSEGHTSELQSQMRSSYAVFCLKKKKNMTKNPTHKQPQKQN